MDDGLIPFTLDEYRVASPEARQRYWAWRRKSKDVDRKYIKDVGAIRYTKAYRARPEVKAHIREQQKAYCARPEVKAHRKAYKKAYYLKHKVKP